MEKRFFKAKPNVKEVLFILFFSLMVVFNFIIFNQFDIMLNNPGEFPITFGEAVWHFIWRAVVVLIIIIGILYTVLYFHKKTFKYTVAVILGWVISSYMQVLFLNNPEYMVATGAMNRASVSHFVWNFILHIIIIALPSLILFIYGVFLKRKKQDGNKRTMPRLALGLTAVIFGMQMIGLVSVAASAPRALRHNELFFFSVDQSLQLSENKNVIVFIIDRLDHTDINQVFSMYPCAVDVFGGFTRFTDNLAEFPGTFPSVISLLTARPFTRDITSQPAYRQAAWQNEILFQALRDEEFVTYGLLDSTSTIYDFNDLFFEDGEPKFSNIRKLDPRNRVLNHSRFFRTITRMGFIRSSPMAIGSGLAREGLAGMSYDLDRSVQILNTPDYFPTRISVRSDRLFYDKLNEIGLSANLEQDVFSFKHFNGSHTPYIFDRHMNIPGRETNSITQTRGIFHMLDEYFRQMDDLGVFDDATIIVMADHGRWWDENLRTMRYPPLGALLIKEPGYTRLDPLGIDTSEVSHANFHATILEIIGAGDRKSELPLVFQQSYFDIRDGSGTQVRYFHVVNWVNLSSHVFRRSYRIKGPAADISSWHLIN